MKTLPVQNFLDKLIDKYILRFIPRSFKPNLFTFIRIALVPYVYILLEQGQTHAALVLFLIAASTDFIDGALARTRNQITDLGKLLDPIADKLLIVVVLVYIGFEYLVVKIFIIVIAFEMVGVLTQALFAGYLGRPIPANVFGKIKMILQSICVMTFLVGIIFKNDLVINISENILIIALMFAFVSAIEQAKKAFIRQRCRIKGMDVKY